MILFIASSVLESTYKNWFCQTTNPARLCEFGTRVSSSDILITASLSATNGQLGFEMRKFCVCWSWCVCFGFHRAIDSSMPEHWSHRAIGFPMLEPSWKECNTSITRSQRSRAGIPSMLKPTSKERTSVSVEPWYLESNKRSASENTKRFLPRLILSPQGRQQSLSLGTSRIDNAET